MGMGHLLEYSISLNYPPPSYNLMLQMSLTIHSWGLLWLSIRKNGNVACHVLQEISSACVDAKLRGTQVTMVLSVVTRDDPYKLTPCSGGLRRAPVAFELGYWFVYCQ